MCFVTVVIHKTADSSESYVTKNRSRKQFNLLNNWILSIIIFFAISMCLKCKEHKVFLQID